MFYEKFFEREVLINNNPIPYDMCIMVSMVNGRTKMIPTSELVFKDKFVDSCGMASHTLTNELIWRAYKEFFERQSFIANFLFQLPSVEIKINEEADLCKTHKYLNNYLDEIHYYNVSLSKNLFVILAIGWSEKSKAAGLGTSRDIDIAIDKSQKEILQYFAVSVNKEKMQGEKFGEENNKEFYHRNFEKLSIKSFKKHYDYLSNSKEVNVEKLKNSFKYGLSDIVKENYNNFSMEPYICLFNGRENTGVKIVKLRDFNWFPHMRPGIYDNNLVAQMENKFQRKIKKSIDLIPFA